MARRRFLIASGVLALSLAPVGAGATAGKASDSGHDAVICVDSGHCGDVPTSDGYATHVVAPEQLGAEGLRSPSSLLRPAAPSEMPGLLMAVTVSARGPPCAPRG